MVLRLGYTYLKSTHDAKDICQDVLLKLLTCRTAFESKEHERAWVVRVTINTCKNWLASSARARTTSLDQAAEAAAPETDAGVDSAVLAAVNELPESQREAVYLHYYEGYKIAEIAALTGRSEDAVAKNLSRARHRLRTMLEGDDDGFQVHRHVG